MRGYKSSDGNIIYHLNKKMCFFRRKNGKGIFYFKDAKGFEKFGGWRNLRFRIHLRPQEGIIRGLRVLIILPVFYWEKNNNYFKIGMPNNYFIVQRQLKNRQGE